MSVPPKGWQRSVWNERRIDDIVREIVRKGEEVPSSRRTEQIGEIVAGVCFCIAMVLLMFLGAAA